jgi:hypothetical protein
MHIFRYFAVLALSLITLASTDSPSIPIPLPDVPSGQPRRYLSVSWFFVDDPHRGTAPRAPLAIGNILPTYNPEVLCGPLSNACPLPCSFDSSKGCSRRVKNYVICGTPALWTPGPDDVPLDIQGIPWSAWNDADIFPFRVMYVNAPCDKSAGPRPIEHYSPGFPNIWMEYLYVAQEGASNPDTLNVYIMPEFRPLDQQSSGTNVSPQIVQVYKNSMADQSQALTEFIRRCGVTADPYHNLGNANKIALQGHSYGGLTAFWQLLGNTTFGLVPYSGPGTIIALETDDPTVQAISNHQLKGHLDINLAQFCSQQIIGAQGCEKAWGLNLELFGNIMLMPNNSMHTGFQFADLMISRVFREQGIAFGSGMPHYVNFANASTIIGRIIRNRLKYGSLFDQCFVHGSNNACDSLANTQQVYQDEEQPQDGEAFQWWHKPVGNRCWTKSVIKGIEYSQDNYFYSGYNPPNIVYKMYHSSSAYMENDDELCVSFPQPSLNLVNQGSWDQRFCSIDC